MECAMASQRARARSTWAVVRFVSFSLRRIVLHNCMMSNSSYSRILTNREARWGSALAVFGATDQSKITVPSRSSVKLLGVKAAISDQRLAVIHASRKTTRSLQSVRSQIYRFISSSVKGCVCLVSVRAAISFSPRTIMSSGVRFISNMDRSILACCRRVDGATNIAAKSPRSSPR
ncbi:hypothetical protein C3747_12g153 [Trypanosoma cruzi]|uniref:Uncharacterized protein n=1 Tax=Trypanosoma cruzi TaxID=5693 RepID=A0A2V2XD45_TRYCR|nr:hypothetical protein C3747_12g153 [Trypanosoma cruzi]